MADTDAVAGQAAEPQALEFRAEIRQLLNILAHSLYTEREIFLREIISNASDALNRVRFEQLTNQDVLDPDVELAIRVTADKEAKILRVEDTGIGMTRDDLIENLGTIAHSGAMSFLSRLQQEPNKGADIIGQFGVGFYSVFMVADEVRVISRSYLPDAEAVQWVSRGENTYTITPADKTTRGTIVEMVLRDDASEFLDTWRLQQVIRRHSNYVAFPIYVGDNETPVNKQTALWRRNPREVSEEEYNDFYQQLTFDFEKPLLHIHFRVEAPLNVSALLYIPSHREQSVMRPQPNEGGLQLYSRSVLIQEHNSTILPAYFRFVSGVVDSEDLPLNISRETVQMQAKGVMDKLGDLVTKRVQSQLEKMASNDAEQYKKFWEAWSPLIKEGVSSDFAARESLAKLLRYPSSRSEGDELVSLQQYIERMPEDQDAIYYLLADNRASAEASPHLDPFKARNLEVLYFLEPIDSFVAVNLTTFNSKQLRNVDDPNIQLPPLSEEEAAKKPEQLAGEEFAPLLLRFRQVLGDRVIEVREAKNLTTSPARLIAPADDRERDLQRVRRFFDEKYEVPKRIMELNRGSALIKNLGARVHANPADPALDLVIEQLYDSALLQEGLHPNPANMVTRIQQIMEAAVQQAPTSAAQGEPISPTPDASKDEPLTDEEKLIRQKDEYDPGWEDLSSPENTIEETIEEIG